MSARRIRSAALAARARLLLLRDAGNPADRALVLVVIARAVADLTALDFVDGTARNNLAEHVSAERVLTAALEHLQAVRTATPAATGPGADNPQAR